MGLTRRRGDGVKMPPTTLRSPPLVAEVGLEIGFAEDPETKDLVARKVLGNQGLARWKPGNQDGGFSRISASDAE